MREETKRRGKNSRWMNYPRLSSCAVSCVCVCVCVPVCMRMRAYVCGRLLAYIMWMCLQVYQKEKARAVIRCCKPNDKIHTDKWSIVMQAVLIWFEGFFFRETSHSSISVFNLSTFNNNFYGNNCLITKTWYVLTWRHISLTPPPSSHFVTNLWPPPPSVRDVIYGRPL